MSDKPAPQPSSPDPIDVAAERERYQRKVARRTQEIRESGDRWLEKLAQMPRDSGRFRKP